jgi:signal transduction histidine kinase
LSSLTGVPLRVYLIALAFAVALPFACFSGYLVLRDDQQSLRVAESAAIRTAQNTAAGTEQLLRSARELLEQIARRTSIDSSGGVQCDPFIGSYPVLTPGFLNVIAVDRQGALLCSAREFKPGEFSPVSDRPWFRNVMKARAPLIGEPVVGRISKEWVAPFTIPIIGPGGEVLGAVSLAIPLVDLRPVAQAARSYEGSIAGIITEGGTIVARSLDPARWVGVRLSPDTVKAVTDSGFVSFEGPGVDGVRRFVAYARIPGTPWIAFGGLPSAPITTERRSNLVGLIVVSLVAAILAALGAVLLGRRVVRPMSSMADVARDVAAGAVDQRALVAGPRELREVAGEFNGMLDRRSLAESELRQLAARLQALSQRLIEVEERERRKINRELHDRIGQNLAVLNLNLSMLLAKAGDAQPALHTGLRSAQQLVETTTAHVRDVMGELRPPALDDYGLLAALDACAEKFIAGTGLNVTVTGEEIMPRLALPVETALFRIAQEALTNAAKHAQARNIEVSLNSRHGMVSLCVVDDGIGMASTLHGASQAGTWGLTTMAERAHAIGAHLEVASDHGKGTSVTVRVENPSP